MSEKYQASLEWVVNKERPSTAVEVVLVDDSREIRYHKPGRRIMIMPAQKILDEFYSRQKDIARPSEREERSEAEYKPLDETATLSIN
jgi:hypothetical protein